MNSTVERRIMPKKSFRWLNVLVFVIVLFFCVNLGIQMQQFITMQQELNYQQEQLAFIEAEYEAHATNQEMFFEDAYIEQMARERLGMVKEGEESVSVLEVEVIE
jgi:cell division protein FtsB